MTGNQKHNWKKYCSEPLELVENYRAAEKDDFKGWCLHHKREIENDGSTKTRQELIDKGMYWNRPADELVFMTNEAHHKLHGKHPVKSTAIKISQTRLQRIANGEIKVDTSCLHTPEVRAKISIAAKKRLAEKNNHPMYGKHQSEESRKKNSLSQRGRHWWNDGVSCKRAKECPGPEWKPGRILKP